MTTMQRTPALPDRSRRRLLGGVMALGGAGLLGASLGVLAARGGSPATPRMTAGPFYPRSLPADRDADLAQVAGQAGTAAGLILYLSGRVLDTRGRPVSGARIELWQANTHGRYTHPADGSPAPLDPNFQGYGVLVADAEGRYQVRTVKPGPYSSRTPHIHFAIAGGDARLVTQMFFEGERANEGDFLYRSLGREERRAVTAHSAERPSGADSRALALGWDIVLHPAG